MATVSAAAASFKNFDHLIEYSLKNIVRVFSGLLFALLYLLLICS
jgi:hypothetical protein